MTLFAVTLRGSYVFHECSIFCLIKDTTEETLKRVKREIEEKHNLKMDDFSRKYGFLSADTDFHDVRVFVEEVEIFE